jgi:hypothetical protein
MYHLELGSEGRSFAGRAIVVNSKTGEHFSQKPVAIETAREQMRELEKADRKPDADKALAGLRKVESETKARNMKREEDAKPKPKVNLTIVASESEKAILEMLKVLESGCMKAIKDAEREASDYQANGDGSVSGAVRRARESMQNAKDMEAEIGSAWDKLTTKPEPKTKPAKHNHMMKISKLAEKIAEHNKSAWAHTIKNPYAEGSRALSGLGIPTGDWKRLFETRVKEGGDLKQVKRAFLLEKAKPIKTWSPEYFS